MCRAVVKLIYLYNACILLHRHIIIARQRDHRNSYTVVVVVHFLGTRETLIMNEFHCIWYSIQHYLSLALYGNHTTNVESSPRLWYRQKRSPLRCGHLRTDTATTVLLSIPLYAVNEPEMRLHNTPNQMDFAASA